MELIVSRGEILPTLQELGCSMVDAFELIRFAQEGNTVNKPLECTIVFTPETKEFTIKIIEGVNGDHRNE